MTYCVGLTGGIGCGKSTVARLFQEMGAIVIDTDAISHHLTQKDEAGYAGILREFGSGYLSGSGDLDRGKLRQKVFADPHARHRLEAILHPLIQKEVMDAIESCQTPYAIVVVPLLLETGTYLSMVQRVLVVDCSKEDQITRTRARSGMEPAEVEAIIAAQISREKRLEAADDILENKGLPEDLRPAVQALHQQYLKMAINP
jgi:dephospho-CoA kinase